MNNVSYIGYREKVNDGVGVVPLVAVAAAKPIAAIITTAISLLPTIIPFISNMFKAPAKDAKRLIDALKPQLQSVQSRDRLGLVIATGQKIADSRKDVEAKELLLWYRQAYPEDFKTLLVEDKIFFNNYLLSLRGSFADGNNMYANLDRAMFSDAEINFNANPIQSITNLISNKNNLLIYGGIALGLLLLLKK
jgi:hypothetical protein